MPDQNLSKDITFDKLRSGVDSEALKKVIPSLRKGTITMMFTDIKGSTALKAAMGGDKIYIEKVLRPHNSRLKTLIEQNKGITLNTMGDAFFAAFQGAKDAINCAVEIQKSLNEDPIKTTGDDILSIRIGLHTGEPIVEINEATGKIDLFGNDVDQAARIEARAHGGQVLVSRQTSVFAESDQTLHLHSHGKYRLKGLKKRQELIEILWDQKQPLRPLGGYIGNLPVFPSSFIGREKEINQIIKDLIKKKNRMVSLVSIGGLGKTRIALEVALRLKDTDLRYHDIGFASLEQVKEDNEQIVLESLLAAFEVDVTGHGGIKEALIAEFKEASALLILDNCETAPDSTAKFVYDLLKACPDLKVFATTQNPLRIQSVEKEIPLNPMPFPEETNISLRQLKAMDSFKLFQARSELKGQWKITKESANKFAEILQLTDGIPLAIELVGSWVQVSTPDSLVRDLT